MPVVNLETSLYLDQLCFVQRKSDGKLLRGSMFFARVKTWRKASLLSPDRVRQLFELGALETYGIGSMDDIDLLVSVKQL